MFDDVRLQIRVSRPRVRTAGVAYLAYCLLDAVVDRSFVLLKKMPATSGWFLAAWVSVGKTIRG